MEVKGLPEYSIEGGICNEPSCLYICTVLCNTDGIWYCEKHAREHVTKFIELVATVNGSVI